MGSIATATYQWHYIFLREKPRTFATDAAIHRVTGLLENHIANAKIESVHPFWDLENQDPPVQAWRWLAKPGAAVKTPEPVNAIRNGWGATGSFSGITFLSDPGKMDFRPEFGCEGWYMVVVKIETNGGERHTDI